MPIDTSQWKKFGESANASFYDIEPHVIAVVPTEGCTDDGVTAQASVEMQLAYLRPLKRKAGVIVFMDPIVQQTTEARAVYRDAPDPAHQSCFALVGGTFFGRAVGSVFLGLSRPRVPTQMFGTLEEALVWCRAQSEK